MTTELVHLAAPAAPIAAATAVFWNSTYGAGSTNASVAGGCGPKKVTWFEVSFLSVSHDSAANGLKLYASSDGGSNWDQIETGITIAASVAGTVNTYRRYVGGYRDFKAEYTAGATGPTTWRVSVKLTVGDHSPVS